MKKFMKVCAITALILLVLGFVMAIVVGVVGGTAGINEVVESVTDGKMQINLGNGDGFGISINGEEWVNDEFHYEITDNMIFESGYSVLGGDVEKYAVGSNVTKLNIEAGGCVFYFEESEDSNFYVEAKEAGKFQCFIKNDTLYVKTTRTVIDWEDYDECEITLYIPEAYSFEKVTVELGAGYLEMDNMFANEVDLEVGAGQIIADYLQAEKCDIEVGMGEILVHDMQVTIMNAEVGMGHLLLKGTLLGDVNAECAMGAMELNLTGSEAEFNYAIETAMGNISVEGVDYSGVGQEKTIKNGAGKTMNLECAMGNIEVDFEE